MASLTSIISKANVPIIGSVNVALQYTLKKAAKAPQYALWAIPAVAGGAWFIWPAVSEETKISWGIKADSEAAAMEVSAKEELKKPVVLEELDKSANRRLKMRTRLTGMCLLSIH